MMLQIDRAQLIKQLGPGCEEVLTNAANLAASQGAYEISVEHFLYCAVALPASDASHILRHFDIRKDTLKDAIAHCFTRQATGASVQPTFSSLLIEMMQEAWLLTTVELSTGALSARRIRTGAMVLAGLLNASKYLNFAYVSQLDSLSVGVLRARYGEICGGSIEADAPASAPTKQGEGAANLADSAEASVSEGLSFLPKYGTNFTALAREGKIDPVFCRDAEIDQMIDVLSRRRKNNPIAVGEAGVGKTAIVEGLALRLASGDCPAHLADYDLWGLDLGALQAGASVKGEFEKRLQGVLSEATQASPPLILFIDEAHTLIGAGGQAGGSDAANLLKPALARGALKTIAATTWSEYKKYFEKDPALTRRFQLIHLKEPTPEAAEVILEGLVPAFEAAHGVYIHGAAVREAAQLSARYISGRQLPDKAIDVLDTAAARVKVALSEKPRALDHLERQIEMGERRLQALARDQRVDGTPETEEAGLTKKLADQRGNAEALSAQWKREQALVTQLIAARDAALVEPATPAHMQAYQALQAQWQNQGAGGDARLISPLVSAGEVAAVVADWTGVPLGTMRRGEAEKVAQLEQHLGATIKGQDEALMTISNALKGATAGLSRPHTPRGVFLAVGPSGVGKTETALQIAEVMFGGEQFLTTINLSEFQERHSISRLIGSPPGYIGYGEGGVLSEAIRRNPYGVVLLDELEKADPEVLNLFYQVFDKGVLSDGEGREIDCRNTVFFLTSNLGAELVEANPELEGQALASLIHPVLTAHMKPALVARMDVVPYRSLSMQAMTQIIELKIARVNAQLADVHGTQGHWTPAARAALRARCVVGGAGARLIDQIIERQVLPEASTRLLLYVAQNIQAAHMIVDFEAATDSAGTPLETGAGVFTVQFAQSVAFETPDEDAAKEDAADGHSADGHRADETADEDEETKG